MTSDETEAERLVRQFFETLSTGDLEALRPLLHRRGRAGKPPANPFPAPESRSGRDHDHRRLPRPGARPVRARATRRSRSCASSRKGPWAAAETEAMGKLSNGKDYHNRYAWIDRDPGRQDLRAARVHGHGLHPRSSWRKHMARALRHRHDRLGPQRPRGRGLPGRRRQEDARARAQRVVRRRRRHARAHGARLPARPALDGAHLHSGQSPAQERRARAQEPSTA